MTQWVRDVMEMECVVNRHVIFSEDKPKFDFKKYEHLLPNYKTVE